MCLSVDFTLMIVDCSPYGYELYNFLSVNFTLKSVNGTLKSVNFTL